MALSKIMMHDGNMSLGPFPKEEWANWFPQKQNGALLRTIVNTLEQIGATHFRLLQFGQFLESNLVNMQDLDADFCMTFTCKYTGDHFSTNGKVPILDYATLDQLWTLNCVPKFDELATHFSVIIAGGSASNSEIKQAKKDFSVDAIKTFLAAKQTEAELARKTSTESPKTVPQEEIKTAAQQELEELIKANKVFKAQESKRTLKNAKQSGDIFVLDYEWTIDDFAQNPGEKAAVFVPKTKHQVLEAKFWYPPTITASFYDSAWKSNCHQESTNGCYYLIQWINPSCREKATALNVWTREEVPRKDLAALKPEERMEILLLANVPRIKPEANKRTIHKATLDLATKTVDVQVWWPFYLSGQDQIVALPPKDKWCSTKFETTFWNNPNSWTLTNPTPNWHDEVTRKTLPGNNEQFFMFRDPFFASLTHVTAILHESYPFDSVASFDEIPQSILESLRAEDRINMMIAAGKVLRPKPEGRATNITDNVQEKRYDVQVRWFYEVKASQQEVFVFVPINDKFAAKTSEPILWLGPSAAKDSEFWPSFVPVWNKQCAAKKESDGTYYLLPKNTTRNLDDLYVYCKEEIAY